MSISRIEISIKDNKRFGLVAFLVDRPDFLTDIARARDLLKISSIPYTLPIFPYEEANNVSRYYQKGACTIYDAYSCFKDICKENNIYLAELEITLASTFVLAKSMAKKLGKNSGVYIPVILASILVGTVRDEDVLPTTGMELNKKSLSDLKNELGEDEKRFVIAIDRESTWEEVKRIFTHIQKYQLGIKKIKNKEQDTFYNIYKKALTGDYLPDTVTNIKRDRAWYWQKMEGMSYEEIRRKTEKADKPGSWQAVRNAISRYKLHLT